MQYNQKTSRARGAFTLIELSAVILIMSLMLAGILTIQNQKLRAERLAETNEKLAAISEALYHYRLLNNRLPCPGDSSLAITHANFGLQADGTTCADAGGTIISNNNSVDDDAFGGAVPVITLGLPADYAVDGWGAYFTYYVHSGATSDSITGTSSIAVSLNAIRVLDESFSLISENNIFAVVLSHGPNGHGAFLPSGLRKNAAITNAQELDNCMCTSAAALDSDEDISITTQRNKQNATAAADSFDDIVAYFPRNFFYTPSEISASQ